MGLVAQWRKRQPKPVQAPVSLHDAIRFCKSSSVAFVMSKPPRALSSHAMAVAYVTTDPWDAVAWDAMDERGQPPCFREYMALARCLEGRGRNACAGTLMTFLSCVMRHV